MLVGDPVLIVVSREEVEALETSSVMNVLRSCLASTERALSLFESLDIAFHGYDDDTRELCEIPAVREYVSALDNQFPYWLFFLTKTGLGLQGITYCLMPPYLSEEGRRTVLPRKLDELLSCRWFPAMNQLCLAVGFSEQQIEDLTNRTVEYFLKRSSSGLPLIGSWIVRASSEKQPNHRYGEDAPHGTLPLGCLEEFPTSDGRKRRNGTAYVGRLQRECGFESIATMIA